MSIYNIPTTYREASEIWHRYEDANQKRGFVPLGNSLKLLHKPPRFEHGVWKLGEYVLQHKGVEIQWFTVKGKWLNGK